MKKALAAMTVALLMATPALAETSAPDGGLKLNLKGITVNVGGFLEAASIYRSRNLNSDLSTPFQRLPLRNSPGYYQDETRFSARQSRLSVLVKGDYDQSTHLAGYYEMDFLGAAPTANSVQSNSFTPRTRHLYSTIDWDRLGLHLLAGQSWSLVTMNGEGIIARKEAIPFTIDSQYVPGYTWARQPQFRLVKDWDKKYWLGLSVENGQMSVASQPNPVGTNFANNQPGGGNFASNVSAESYPDFVVKAAADPGWGHYEIFSLIRVFESGLARSGAVNTTNKVTSAVGGGVILPLVPKQLKLYLSGIYGKGIGRYGSAQFPDMTQAESGENKPLKGSQLLAGLTYDPSSDWTLYAYYGQEQMDKESFSNAAGLGFGYGSELYNNSGAGTLGGTVNGNIKKISQETVGAWWKFYQGNMGRMQAGLQYSHTENKYFFVNNGGAPKATDHMAFASLRYYWQ